MRNQQKRRIEERKKSQPFRTFSFFLPQSTKNDQIKTKKIS